MASLAWIAILALIPIVFGKNSYDEWKENYDRNRVGKLGWYPVRSSHGRPIPLPKSMKVNSQEPLLTILPTQFEIIPIGAKCDILTAAVQRYFKLILQGEYEDGGWPWYYRGVRGDRGVPSVECEKRPFFLHKLYIDVAQPCEGGIHPAANSMESYSLEVLSFGAVLKATEIWGALRGLETFSQMVYREPKNQCLQIAQSKVVDEPRFSYRGILLDTGRHFLSKEVILRNLDAMSYSKFNVFHWHIVDDENFPYPSTSFPNMTLGAYSPKHLYTQNDVAEVIEYARLRGIRVVPEFDSPGHSLSWGKALKNLLTPCYSKDGKPTGQFGPVDPSKNSTFDTLKTLVKEWKSVFPDQYIHLGGDEVSFSCWESNPNIKKWMKTMNITSYGQVENYYLQRLFDIVSSQKMRYICWQDPLGNGVKLDPATVVQIWLGSGDHLKKYLKQVTAAGYQTILSSPWYLNYLGDPYGWGFLENYYKADPQNFNGTAKQKSLVIGGEACMWGEYTDNTNALVNLWPTASIVAERLWSTKDTTDFNDMFSRVKEMQCRMVHRGIPAYPISGPGYCDQEWMGV